MRRTAERSFKSLLVGAQVGVFSLCLASFSACASSPDPTPGTTLATASATAEATASVTATVASTVSASGTPATSSAPSPSADTSGVPTRLVIASLAIDLPVIRLPASGIHYCGVALWWAYPGFVAPGEVGSAYLLAHSRAGMFLPLLNASLVDGGRSLLGLRVQLYTSADWVFTYGITMVRRHMTSSGTSRLKAPLAATDAELWLQTSEGPSTASPYLQVAARLLSAVRTSHTSANPTPRPYLC